MPEQPKTIKVQIRELEAETLVSGPQTTHLPPPREESRKIVAAALANALKAKG